MTTVAVLGPGGVGGFVAAALQRAGAAQVTVVARRETAAAIKDGGITVKSRLLGDFTTQPATVTELRDDVDVLIVATKATGLTAALERIHATPHTVVPLLNGIDHLALLRQRFPRVPAAVIRIESDRPRPATIMQSSPGARIDISADDGRLAQLFEQAGFDVRTGGREPDVMWSKLARLCPLALTTTASDRPVGLIRNDPRWRSALHSAVHETIAVAKAEGARLDAQDTLAELERAHPELGSSMQRDVAAGREPELDAIAGAVLRAAARHDIDCPAVRWLAERVRERYSGGRTGAGASM